MPVKWLILCLFALLYCCSFCSSVGICGDDYTGKYQAAFDETVDRLMAMRQTSWSWMFPRTIVLLQAIVPSRLVGREKTISKMKQDWLKNEQLHEKQDLRFQALEAVALHSLCVDVRSFMGANLVQRINDRMQAEFEENGQTTHPKNGYGPFSIGIGALCLTNHSISADLIRKTIGGQNSDGSFGIADPIGDTIKLLPALHCLRTMKNPLFNMTAVDISVRRVRQYIISLVKTNDMGEVVIGNKDITGLALAGLWFSRDPGEDASTWKCLDAVQTVGFKPSPNDNEFILGDHLIFLTGKGYLDVGREDYTCVQPDIIPAGYRPTCIPGNPTTCQPNYSPPA